MQRQHSKNGCRRCKLRRKKCDEGRPVCSGCARWPQWSATCSYGGTVSAVQSSSVVIMETSKYTSKALSTRRLPAVQHAGDEIESRVLQTIPGLIQALFSPACADHNRDLQTMWQLMMNNHMLRNACVACFSMRIDGSLALTRLSRETYFRTLQAVRSKILGVDLDQETTICVITSIAFLGKMELFKPESDADALEHWLPLIPLLVSDRITRLSQRGILPPNEMTLLFEMLLYHVGTDAIFSRATIRVWDLWQAHRVYGRLCIHNPDNSGRIGRSAFLWGQYELYNMALRVTYLLRCHPDGHLSPSMADEMEEMIRYRDARLDHYFAVTMSDTTNTAKQSAECAIYHFFCNSLLICITALREPSQFQRRQMEYFVASGMQMFLDLPSYGDDKQLSEHAYHFVAAAIWPVEVQGCASYDREQFRDFMDHFVMLELFLDPGHRRRARSLLGQVITHLQRVDSSEEEMSGAQGGRAIPAGLRLLRYPVTTP